MSLINNTACIYSLDVDDRHRQSKRDEETPARRRRISRVLIEMRLRCDVESRVVRCSAIWTSRPSVCPAPLPGAASPSPHSPDTPTEPATAATSVLLRGISCFLFCLSSDGWIDRLSEVSFRHSVSLLVGNQLTVFQSKNQLTSGWKTEILLNPVH